MVVESGVIAVFFLLVAAIFTRVRHKDWGFATLPMMIVPLIYFLMEIVVVSVLHISVSVLAATIVIIVSVAASAAWIGIISQTMKSKKITWTYVSISNAFNIALAAIIVASLLDKSGILDSMVG